MRRRTIQNIVLSLLLVLLYNDWLLGPTLNPHLSTAASLISEISAQDQPYHWVFQMLDISAGLLTLMLLPKVRAFLRNRHVPHRSVLMFVLGCIGLDSIIDASLPIACAPSLDSACNLGTASLITQAHLIESTLVGVLIFLAGIMWWQALKKHHRIASRASLYFVLLQLAVGGSILLTRALGWNEVGWLQRIYEIGIGGWIAGLFYLARLQIRESASPRVPEQPTSVVAVG